MGLLDWVKSREASRSNDDKKGEWRQSGTPPITNEMPFRFEKPFEHLKYYMSPEERQMVDRIDARWKEQYEHFKDYPPMSESQVHERNVFRAVDGLRRALDVRENGPLKDWKRLEVDVDDAFAKVRTAFGEQRNFVAREIAEAEELERKFSPDYRPQGRSR
jgi:hypothetical protein